MVQRVKVPHVELVVQRARARHPNQVAHEEQRHRVRRGERPQRARVARAAHQTQQKRLHDEHEAAVLPGMKLDTIIREVGDHILGGRAGGTVYTMEKA